VGDGCLIAVGDKPRRYLYHSFSLTTFRRLLLDGRVQDEKERMGKVALVTETTVRFYAVGQPSITEIPLAK